MYMHPYSPENYFNLCGKKDRLSSVCSCSRIRGF